MTNTNQIDSIVIIFVVVVFISFIYLFRLSFYLCLDADTRTVQQPNGTALPIE